MADITSTGHANREKVDPLITICYSVSSSSVMEDQQGSGQCLHCSLEVNCLTSACNTLLPGFLFFIQNSTRIYPINWVICCDQDVKMVLMSLARIREPGNSN